MLPLLVLNLHGSEIERPLAVVMIGGLWLSNWVAGLIRAEGITFLSLLGPGETRQSLTVTEGSTGKQFRFMRRRPDGHYPFDDKALKNHT